MPALLRKLSPFKPVVAALEDDHDVFNTDYSIAMEYVGPPVTYDIPHALPVDFTRISTASTVLSSSSPDRNLSLGVPVIQPIGFTRKGREPVMVELPGELQNYMDPKNWESTEESEPSSPSRLSSETIFEETPPPPRPSVTFRGLETEEEIGSPEIVELPGNYTDPRKWELEPSSPSRFSSEIIVEEAETETPPAHARKLSVTFREPESNDRWSESSAEAELEEEEERPRRRAVRAGPKGSCYRCGRGGRLTEKEECIVCGAKYCRDCMLRSMGSMPEGRKCLGCIGERIDEGARRRLGRRSRLLRKLLCDLEVDEVMKAEAFCRANQLPASLVRVNSEPLTPNQLLLLQTCPRPPRRLKPGDYWYDNVSGFWGKEGHVYSEIISPQLSVGGHIKKNCSNGNTDIMINNREITRIELRILQLAGVPCEGKIHYWVNPDGSYQEEGMKNVKGIIWDKPTVKLACALFSLPILSESSKPPTATDKVDQAAAAPLDDKMLNKFLLIGPDRSGTSTVFKQAKRMYNVPFSEEERQNIKSMIQSKLYGYIGLLLEGRERFEEESLCTKGRPKKFDEPGPSGAAEQETTIYSIGPRLKSFEDWLLKVMTSGNLEVMIPAATREYARYVEDLWNDPAIQATYSRRNELETLPRAASYFLNRAVEISRTDYEPTDTDILYAEGITSSNRIASMEFSCPIFEQDNISGVLILRNPNPTTRSQLIRVHPRILGEKCKWLPMFEDVDMVLFCVSLSDYDEYTPDGTNRMAAARRLFESVVTHPSLERKQFLLMLNKFDLLEEKIERVPLTRCEWFSDFSPVISSNPNKYSPTSRRRSTSSNSGNSPALAHRAFQYIAFKFKRLFHSLTDGKLYVSLINGLESDTIDESLRFAAEILKWEEERPKLSADQQISSASIEASSSS